MITERDFARTIGIWGEARAARVGLSKSTRNGILKRCAKLSSMLNTDSPLSEKTVMKVLEAPGQYSYRYRLAKKLLWSSKWAAEQGLIPNNPLFRVRIPRPRFDHRKVYLTVEEMRELEGLPLSGHLENIRDLFLLQCYTGLAYADLKRLSRYSYYQGEDREFIYLTRQKTSNGFLTVLRKEAKAILEKWEWRLRVPCNQVYNRFLKELQRVSGLAKPLFSHLGRKTFAQFYTERGLSLQITASMMGITDVRTLTTHYATINVKSIENGLKTTGL